ncbi:MAG: ketoacyl-ACP synthase III [Spirochaetaceae bacterium]|nr:MAG: ketoacyl-ACP synthase III [Spirochaetaceae bacterium]
MSYARIAGTGLYAPGEPITNEELMSLAGIEFDADRYREKIGIGTRHIARLRGLEETTADFAEQAARRALADAKIDASDVDLFIVATDTPEYISPPTAVLMQGRLQGGQTNSGSFDINASCAGFATAYDTAARIVASDPDVHTAVVTGVYNMPAYARDGDAFGLSIFADGAGSFVLTKADEAGYVATARVSDGTQWDFVGVYAGGTKRPITHEVLDEGTYGLQLLKRLPGDRNVKLWPDVVHRVAARAGFAIKDIDQVIYTQINRSVIEQVNEILGIPMTKSHTIMDRYGYTGSACVPMAFADAVAQGAVSRGDRVVFVASGAGLAVTANAFIY